MQPPFTWTAGQKAAEEAFQRFILDPARQVMVLKGYSGTGKSTLVKHLVGQINDILRMLDLIDPHGPEWDLQLTATTNQAADSLARITGRPVKTIHSALRLRVKTQYPQMTTTLFDADPSHIVRDTILIIDEASYIDDPLLNWIFKKTQQCKILLIGDDAQLIQHTTRSAPAFCQNYDEACLTEVVRHDGPILDLATQFRQTVLTGEWFNFTPDGHHIQHLGRNAWGAAIKAEFSRPDWQFSDSKVLVWRNKTVIAYNQGIRNFRSGEPELQVGDFAVCNSFVNNAGYQIKTDQLVCITQSEPGTDLDVPGRWVVVDHGGEFFLPDSLELTKHRVKIAQQEDDYASLARIDNQWIDLRAAFSCTINKAQGSTYDTVFLDLDDLKRCNIPNQLARLLYVGVSRASRRLILTGDLV